jgi:hypothetical protein
MEKGSKKETHRGRSLHTASLTENEGWFEVHVGVVYAKVIRVYPIEE